MDPEPGALTTLTPPPWASAIRLTMARPSPVHFSPPVGFESPGAKSLKRPRRELSERPGPSRANVRLGTLGRRYPSTSA